MTSARSVLPVSEHEGQDDPAELQSARLLIGDLHEPTEHVREPHVLDRPRVHLEQARARDFDATAAKRELPPLEADAVATFETLKRRRLVQASEEGVRAFMVVGNRTLEEIARRFPQTLDKLAEVPGVGPAKLARYGEDVLRTLAAVPAEPVGARLASPADGVFETLRTWRRERAQADGVPAYVVFHDATLERIAGREPRTLDDLAEIEGVGPAKLERYGEDVLAALTPAARAAR